MEDLSTFKQRVKDTLTKIGSGTTSYNEDEFWIIQAAYEYIEFYAYRKRLYNTAIALVLSRGLHNGSYRKSKIIKDGVTYKVPYVIHCLSVARMLADLHVNMDDEHEDILLASALCHDMIEDIDFPNGGKELYQKYYLDERVYKTVKLVSKRYDFTTEQEKEFFHQIESNKLSLLVKLADRGHNVEDLYNMSLWKIHEYTDETEKFFMPMCEYGLKNYPDIVNSISILKDKLSDLTTLSKTLVDRYTKIEESLQAEVNYLRIENKELRARWKQLWEN